MGIFKKERRHLKKILRKEQTAFRRFPLLFALMGTFGVVSIFHGLARIIERIPLINNNPFILVALGVVTLIFTGTLYKRIG